MIEWTEDDEFFFGNVGEKRLFEIFPTCEKKGFAVVCNIGLPETKVRDEENKRFTLEQAKSNCEDVLKGWLEIIGIDYYA